MIRHQSPRVDAESTRRCQLGNATDEVFPVDVVAKDRTSLDASPNHVVERTGSVKPRTASHRQAAEGGNPPYRTL